MNIMLPIVLAGALAGSIIAVADNPPNFNVAPGCRAAAALNQEMDLSVSQDYKSCMADEESARAELDQNWATYAAADKQRCVGQIDTGGMPSYVEVLECLQVTVNVGNPVPPHSGREYEQAIKTLKEIQPLDRWSHGLLAACYAQIGRLDETRSEINVFISERERELKDRGDAPPPRRSDLARSRADRYRNPLDHEHFLDGLRKAGLTG